VRLDDPDVVRREYADESRFAARASAWETSVGSDPRDLAVEAIADVRPRTILEVGCGRGELAERIQRELGCELRAVDQSQRMVDLTRSRGIDAELGDVHELRFADGSFDAAIAAWMLYHVPELDRGLAELARVLRPGGRLVAVTNTNSNLPELWSLVGRSSDTAGSFNAENGAELLGRHFERVEERDARGTMSFPDREAAREYVAASIVGAEAAHELPHWDGPLVCTRLSRVFVAETAA